MLKWIASGCLVIVLIVAGVMYFGYRKMSSLAEQGPAVTVAIAATPERVFASLANADSIAQWRTSVRTSGRTGLLRVGDTIRERDRQASDSADALLVSWVVDTIVPNQLLVMRATQSGKGNLNGIRRDSVAGVGDSTHVTSSVVLTFPDSMQAPPAARATALKFMGAGMRLATEMELKALKARIEGGPAARPDSAR
jgi:uncharacterized protein YndB with AHSA1/START domain